MIDRADAERVWGASVRVPEAAVRALGLAGERRRFWWR